MKVRAKSVGYFGGSLKNPGDVFTLKDLKEFSAKWMESLEGRKEEPTAPVVKAKGRHGKEAVAKSSGDADVI